MADAHGTERPSSRIARSARQWAADRLSDQDSTSDQPATRASDAEREAVAERVRAAVTDGRLRLDELDDRLSAVYAAQTRGELDAVAADLPGGPDADPGPLELRTKSGTRRKSGHWVVPSRIVAESTSGPITLDFTAAECHHPEVTVQVTAKSATITLIVPRGWGVNMDKVATASGSLRNKVLDRPAPGAPMLRIQGEVRSGSVVARHPRRTFWQWLTRAPLP